MYCRLFKYVQQIYVQCTNNDILKNEDIDVYLINNEELYE